MEQVLSAIGYITLDRLAGFLHSASALVIFTGMGGMMLSRLANPQSKHWIWYASVVAAGGFGFVFIHSSGVGK